MSAGFRAVQWNRDKLVYDAIVLVGIALYVTAFLTIERWIESPKDFPTEIDLRVRAFGTCAFLLLSIVLSIGPLARLDRRFLVLLYNRRHLGVITFFVTLTHFWFMIDWYLVQGSLSTLLPEFSHLADYGKFPGFPFKLLGFTALLILMTMAATSHDFWLAFLTPPIWKAIHMALYVAYGLIVMHVALGTMQGDRHPIIPIMTGGAFLIVALLHVLAGFRERAADRGMAARDGWLIVGPPESIPDQAARIVAAPGGERIAVFRDGNRISAVTNLCAHQNGPLGEGRVIDGCITCPWHGYQYGFEDGLAPPPFGERIATYPVRMRAGNIEVEPSPSPPGTPAAIAIQSR
jgi:nitrite reductase/ring-hydroxylating ferredoxin subunit/DMSO/TMAO reductase YedYZ heme-binding membrane subunit